MTEILSEIAVTLSVWVLPVLLAVTLHEAAHGYAAWLCGDDTAQSRGRVTLNPLAHIDRFGTILLPGLLLAVQAPFLFGYAKPVPINVARLRNPRRDMVVVAAAGPGANIVLALAAALLLHVLAWVPEAATTWVGQNLLNLFRLNLILAVFNLLPIPPLDGGRILTSLLPYPAAIRLAAIERSGLVLLVGLIFLLPFVGNQLGFQLNVFAWLVGMPAEWLARLMLTVAGHL